MRSIITGPFVATRRASYTVRGLLAAGLCLILAGVIGLAFSGCVKADVIEACGKACASQGGVDFVNAETCICRKAGK